MVARAMIVPRERHSMRAKCVIDVDAGEFHFYRDPTRPLDRYHWVYPFKDMGINAPDNYYSRSIPEEFWDWMPER